MKRFYWRPRYPGDVGYVGGSKIRDGAGEEGRDFEVSGDAFSGR